jgi:hypothetical protein
MQVDVQDSLLARLMMHNMLVPNLLEHRSRYRRWLGQVTHSSFSNVSRAERDRSMWGGKALPFWGHAAWGLVLWGHRGICQSLNSRESNELFPP